MKLTSTESAAFEEKIAIADAKLVTLEEEIRHIGLPAGQDLMKRLEMLKIEERALKRNFEESRLRGEPDSVRMAKIEILLNHIEDEELSVEKDAEFLNQAAPSSMTVAVETGAKMVEIYRKGIRQVLGDSHLLGSSVFVNHSHENLTSEYGLEEERDRATH
ncbi:MAG: hypothetical protein V4640_13610 [Verrucomicrobiota bacterium]